MLPWPPQQHFALLLARKLAGDTDLENPQMLRSVAQFFVLVGAWLCRVCGGSDECVTCGGHAHWTHNAVAGANGARGGCLPWQDQAPST